MSVEGLELLIPERGDEERDAVASAWVAAGGIVRRLDRFWEPPALDRSRVRLYGNTTFAEIVAQKLGLCLVSPPDDLLLRIPAELLRREVSIMTFGKARALSFPAFVKPVVPKLFRAAVYENVESLAAECRGLSDDTEVLVSETVKFTAEARAFVHEGELLDVSIYEGQSAGDEAIAFIEQVVDCVEQIPAFVLDAGLIDGRGWAVVEANAAWGAGLNGCEAGKVLPAIAAATRPPAGHR